jgi:peptidoglycan/xylan/chitin deacetylase (PgdA/CDA1 family)
MTPVRSARPIPILAYHSIGDRPRDGTMRWSVSPGDFDEQMVAIAESGRQALTVARYAAALRSGAELPPDPVLVTFDDGYADLATAALPVLQRYRLVATAFLVSAWLGGRAPDAGPVLTWEQVRELHAHGVQIGSHGHSHRPLDCLPYAEAEHEVRSSREVLADGLGEEVVSFAYPYGYSSPRVRRAVQAAGYSSACGVKNALSHEDDDLFSLARVLVTRDTGAVRVARLLAGEDAPLSWPGERLRTRGWRTYRRARYLVGGRRSQLMDATPVPTSEQEGRTS